MGRLFVETKSRPELVVSPVSGTVERIVEVPKEIEVVREVEVVRTEYIEVPVEVIKEVTKVEYISVPVEVEKIVERIIEKPIEIIKEVEKVIRIEDMAKIQALKSELQSAKRLNKIYAIGVAVMVILTMIMGAGYV